VVIWTLVVNGVVTGVLSFTWQPPSFAYTNINNVPYYCPQAVVTISGTSGTVTGTCSADRLFANGFEVAQ